MSKHGGNWEGKETKELEKFSIAYVNKFGVWPDGYQDFAVNIFDYDEYIELIRKCLEKDISIPDYLPDDFFMDT